MRRRDTCQYSKQIVSRPANLYNTIPYQTPPYHAIPNNDKITIVYPDHVGPSSPAPQHPSLPDLQIRGARHLLIFPAWCLTQYGGGGRGTTKLTHTYLSQVPVPSHGLHLWWLFEIFEFSHFYLCGLHQPLEQDVDHCLLLWNQNFKQSGHKNFHICKLNVRIHFVW